ncbi:MAG: DUF4442 domain-containing protein [Roseibacillus sp.]|jgi:acyl-coenzyme A thioesterase PaaI-like protein
MDLTKLPYHELIGIRRAEDPAALLFLHDEERLHNHLGTFHAAALFSLAEASSAEFLLRNRAERDDVGGVVRRATCKYSAPAHGTITSHSSTPADSLPEAIATVDAKGRALYSINIELRNEAAQTVAAFTFTWFLSKEA